MLLKLARIKMGKDMFSSLVRISNAPSANLKRSYEDAIRVLNSLQTNGAVLQQIKREGKLSHNATVSRTIEEAEKYLLRSGIALTDLDKLPVIHVSGTKGKGSTCAFCESILRHHGYKTGLYTSPHLVAVRERIRLNGNPIDEEKFNKYFWKLYDTLMDKRETENDMPPYFKFLTVLTFNIFLHENIDVAIVEVGLGGEYDCTNIIRKTDVVGISSLGIDHTEVLGNTLQDIAWQKAGIMKKESIAFTVNQTDEAMHVLKVRSLERQCPLYSVPSFDSYEWKNTPPILGINAEIQKINASLAVQLAETWMRIQESKQTTLPSEIIKPSISKEITATTELGLQHCIWPGRTQILTTPKYRFFLDGAHTVDSIKLCIDWFKKHSNCHKPKVLLFNITRDRNSKEFLSLLTDCGFKHVLFTPNVSTLKIDDSSDQADFSVSEKRQLEQCEENKTVWLELMATEVIDPYDLQTVDYYMSVSHALSSLPPGESFDILVTGSLHLVGAVLNLIDPNLSSQSVDCCKDAIR